MGPQILQYRSEIYVHPNIRNYLHNFDILGHRDGYPMTDFYVDMHTPTHVNFWGGPFFRSQTDIPVFGQSGPLSKS